MVFFYILVDLIYKNFLMLLRLPSFTLSYPWVPHRRIQPSAKVIWFYSSCLSVDVFSPSQQETASFTPAATCASTVKPGVNSALGPLKFTFAVSTSHHQSVWSAFFWSYCAQFFFSQNKENKRIYTIKIIVKIKWDSSCKMHIKDGTKLVSAFSSFWSTLNILGFFRIFFFWGLRC